MIKEQQKLPEGWELTTLGQAFNWGSGGTPKSTNPSYYGGDIPWLIIADLNDSYVNNSKSKITLEGLENSSAKWVEEGSVLLAMYGSIGKLGIAQTRLTTNQAIAFTKPSNNESKYLYYYLMATRKTLASLGKGATQQNISQTVIKSFPYVRAPLDQQKQIVSKIEELFSHIDAGIEGLKKAKALLKQYRQSVLKAAVTGELTKDWREANKDKIEPANQLLKRILKQRQQRWEEQQLKQFQAKGKPPTNDKWKEKYKEPKDIEKNVDLEVPEQWCFVTMDSISEIFLGKMLDKSKHTDGEKLGYLRNINVRWGTVDVSDISEMFFKENEIERYRVVKGDVLVCEGGEPGRASVWNNEYSTFYQKALHRVRFFSEEFCSEYLVLYLEFLAKTYRLEKFFTGTTIKHFTKESFLTLPITIPSNAEMNKILEIVEEKLSAADRLMAELDTKLTQAQQQKQTILKFAFNGDLLYG